MGENICKLINKGLISKIYEQLVQKIAIDYCSIAIIDCYSQIFNCCEDTALHTGTLYKVVTRRRSSQSRHFL